MAEEKVKVFITGSGGATVTSKDEKTEIIELDNASTKDLQEQKKRQGT